MKTVYLKLCFSNRFHRLLKKGFFIFTFIVASMQIGSAQNVMTSSDIQPLPQLNNTKNTQIIKTVSVENPLNNYKTTSDPKNLKPKATCTWTGATDNRWDRAANWSGGIPTATDDAIIPAGLSRYPVINTNVNAQCNNLQINAGATLTNNNNSSHYFYINGNFTVNGSYINNTSGDFSIYGNLIINGTYNESGASVYDFLRSTNGIITMSPSAILIDAALYLRSGSSYSLASDTKEFWGIETEASANLKLNSYKLTTQYFINEGTTSLNTGTLEITDMFDGTGITPDYTNPYFGGTMNIGSGTVMYSPRLGIINVQKVRHGITYYNLTLNGRDATTILISDDYPTHSNINISHDFKIINNTGVAMTSGKIATNLNLYGNFRVGGNFEIGSSNAAENNAVIIELTRPIVRTTSGTGFTMYNNAAHKINILWGSADSSAIYNFGNALTFYGTVEYNNSGNQKIMGNTYNNLTISAGGIRNLTANTTINNNLLLNGGTLSTSTSNYNINIKGDWTNKGSFDCRTSNVSFNDKPTPTANVINGKAGTTGFVLQSDFEGTAPGWWTLGYTYGSNWYLDNSAGWYYHGNFGIAVSGNSPLDVWVSTFSPTFNCNGQTHAWLTFFNKNDNNEQQILYVSNNASLGASATWVLVQNYGTSSFAWTKRNYDLASYLTLTSDMGLRWDAFHHSNSRHTGIDSVTIWVRPPSSKDDFYNLTMNRSLGVTVDNSLNIQNNLTMTNGNFNFNSPLDFLEVGTSPSNIGSLTYTNGFINGKMKRWFAASTNTGCTGLFPIGANGYLRSSQVNFTIAPTSGGSLTGFFQTVLPAPADYYMGLPKTDLATLPFQYVDNLPDEGFWELNAGDGLTAGTYSITLTGNGIATVGDITQLRLLKRPSNGTNWEFMGTNGPTTLSPPSVSREDVTGFSQFSWGGFYGVNPLPISLLDFKAIYGTNQVKIEWITASESNNDFFTVERSTDGKLFSQIAIIKGAGNSNTVINYNSTDNKPIEGIAYYRLKQTDFDGKFKYIAVKSINCSQSNIIEPSISAFPNPFSGMLFFEANNLNDNHLTIEIFDVLGKKIENKEINNILINSASISFDLSKYNIGVYYYQFSSGNYLKTGKIIKN